MANSFYLLLKIILIKLIEVLIKSTVDSPEELYEKYIN